MMEYNVLLELIQHSRVACFCGAGMSINSGIPMVPQLLRAILMRLNLSENEIQALLKSNLPFESFMQSFIEATEADRLLDVFEATTLSKGHYFVSELLSRPGNELVITTNFDTLIEQAVQQNTHLSDTPVAMINDNADQRILETGKQIIKIHGSIEHREQLGITLANVASHLGLKDKAIILRKLFVNGSHDLVLIIGYSCSDLFDISPIIASLQEVNKLVILIQHTNSKEFKAEPIGQQSNKNPFKVIRGWRVFINTDVLLTRLAADCGIELQIQAPVASNWETKLDQWIEQWNTPEGTGHKCFLAGDLFRKIQQYILAKQHIKKGLEVYSKLHNDWFYNIRLQDLGLLEISLDQNEEAAQHLLAAMEYYLNHDMVEQFCIASNNYGGAVMRLNRIDEAIEYFELSLLYVNKLTLPELAGARYGNLAGAYFKKGNVEKGRELAQHALELAKVYGDKSLEGNMSYLISVIKNEQDRLAMGLDAFEDSAEIYTNIGQKIAAKGAFFAKLGVLYQAGHYQEVINALIDAEQWYDDFDIDDYILRLTKLVLCYLELDQVEAARKSLKALDHFDFKALANSSQSYILDAHAHFLWKQGDLDAAQQMFEMALSICTEQELDWSVVLGAKYADLLFEMNSFDRLFELLKEMIPIAENINARLSLMRYFSRAGDYFNFITKDRAALSYFTKAYDIALTTNDFYAQCSLLHSIGLTHFNLYEHEQAEEKCQQAHELSTNLELWELQKSIEESLHTIREFL